MNDISKKTFRDLVIVGLLTLVSMISVRYFFVHYGPTLLISPAYTSTQSQDSPD